MKDYEAGRCWESNAEAWTRLARAGWDVFRDYINTPAFFEMLPPVAGLRGLDIGCGEGHMAEELQTAGNAVTGLDVLEPRPVPEAAQAGSAGLDLDGGSVSKRVRDSNLRSTRRSRT